MEATATTSPDCAPAAQVSWAASANRVRRAFPSADVDFLGGVMILDFSNRCSVLNRSKIIVSVFTELLPKYFSNRIVHLLLTNLKT